MNKNLTSNSLRRFLLVTLSHAESRNLSRDEICKRFADTFSCRSIIVAQEQHQETGFHYHVGVLNDNASKNTATQIIRKLFPEFEGKQCVVTFHKGWNTICTYIVKEDPQPLVWGQSSLEDILQIATSCRKKKKVHINTTKLVNKLELYDEWIQVYNEPCIVKKLFDKYSNIKKIYEDIQERKHIQFSPCEKIVKYLFEEGWPQEYIPEEILEKYVFLDWVACQLVFHRPIKTKQLFVYGQPNTQKTLLIHFLSKVLRIYFASSRINDFSGADNYYDLWVFDEFHEAQEQTQSNVYANTLLKVLDGQECRLDAKYDNIFTKKRNVPIIMIANKLPNSIKYPGPMQERFLRIRFHSHIANLDQGRVIATLYGCIYRRVFNNYQFTNGLKHLDGSITYNNSPLVSYPLIPYSTPEKKISPEIQAMWLTFRLKILLDFEPRQRPIAFMAKLICEKKPKHSCYYLFLVFHLLLENGLFTFMVNNDLALIDFAIIPLQLLNDQQKQQYMNTTRIPVFKSSIQGTTFLLFRPPEDKKYDFNSLNWPFYATPLETHNDDDDEENHQNPNHKEMQIPVKLRICPRYHDTHIHELLPDLECNEKFIQNLQKENNGKNYPKLNLTFWDLKLGVAPRRFGYWSDND